MKAEDKRIMVTERLYFGDPYLREFTADVIGRRQIDGHPAVALDRTAFYPTGGGQPNDVGCLIVQPAAGDGAVSVVDVFAADGVVWHVLGGDLAGGTVRGLVDWDCRFDHMQQHSGQHILSQAFVQELGAETVGFHLGVDASSVDLNQIGLTRDDLVAVEAAANGIIDEARPISATFHDQNSLDQVPLRRPPKVTGKIRVVHVKGFDWSACGGTHVANTARIGLIKIVGLERRGEESRISFLCGRRARADYARLQALAEGLVARFNTSPVEMLETIDRRLAEAQAVRRELGEMEAAWVAATAAAMFAGAELRDGLRIVRVILDCPVERAKRLAHALRESAGAVVLMGVRGDRPQLIFTRAEDVNLSAGDLLRSAVAAGGGRGGGRPEWAQGGVPDNAALGPVLAAALAALPA